MSTRVYSWGSAPGGQLGHQERGVHHLAENGEVILHLFPVNLEANIFSVNLETNIYKNSRRNFLFLCTCATLSLYHLRKPITFRSCTQNGK